MSYEQAVRDFREARRQAGREQVWALLTGKSAELLSFDDVRERLGAKASTDIGLQEIPLEAIVGSLGRYSDFTRSFLPKVDADKERWTRVQLAISDLKGLPPIQAYKIGEAYFVHDGNHRVSVARRLGAPTIQGYVTEVHSRVPLTPDVQPDDLIMKAEYADFLGTTRLDEIRPQADLSVTAPGKYPQLIEHIDVHRYYMGLEQRREIPYEEAVGHWYDAVYLPVVRALRELDIVREFPGRTETDLYLWVADHRAELEEELGWQIETDKAAVDLAEQFSPTASRRWARTAQKLLDALTPETFEEGPATGRWRKERAPIHRHDRMFPDILVPVSGQDSGWCAVAQAVELAGRENARLLGLHVVRTRRERDGEAVRTVQAEFARQCAALGVRGSLAVEVGGIARTICDRSRWADLVVVNLSYPPSPRSLQKMGSGFRTLLRCSATPVLAVPGEPSRLQRPLLAYDGSARAREALFVAAYLAARGRIPLAVVSVQAGDQVTPATLEEARSYLKARGVDGTFVQASGSPAVAILNAARRFGCDLILMGSYGRGPVLEMVLGSAVDQVLQESQIPILVCH